MTWRPVDLIVTDIVERQEWRDDARGLTRIVVRYKRRGIRSVRIVEDSRLPTAWSRSWYSDEECERGLAEDARSAAEHQAAWTRQCARWAKPQQ